MPVKEITIFKDGHALVMHEGKMPTDAAGNVLLDHLPTPVIGTFWPYSVDKKAKLVGVTAAKRRVLVEQTSFPLAVCQLPGRAKRSLRRHSRRKESEGSRISISSLPLAGRISHRFGPLAPGGFHFTYFSPDRLVYSSFAADLWHAPARPARPGRVRSGTRIDGK
jgi:hypothetical protein